VPPRLKQLEASHNHLAEMFRQQGNAGTFGKFLRGTAFDVLAKEVGGRTNAAIESDVPFRERLVHFWSNHFTVSAKRPQIAIAVGAFEREALRPHIFGRFADLLVSVTQHPVMLIYLDNFISFGPNSLGGRHRDVGLNENLAREILELHTLGVDGGYTQDDVIELAKLISDGASSARKTLVASARTAPSSFDSMGMNRVGKGCSTKPIAAKPSIKANRHCAT